MNFREKMTTKPSMALHLNTNNTNFDYNKLSSIDFQGKTHISEHLPIKIKSYITWNSVVGSFFVELHVQESC